MARYGERIGVFLKELALALILDAGRTVRCLQLAVGKSKIANIAVPVVQRIERRFPKP